MAATSQSLTERVAALEESNALILARMAELSERLDQATQVEEIIRRARKSELSEPGGLAMARHSKKSVPYLGRSSTSSVLKPGPRLPAGSTVT